MPQLKAQDLHPTQANLRDAARESLDSAVSDEELDRFLDTVKSGKVPDPITADASLKIFGVGQLECRITEAGYDQWVYDNKAYGAAAAVVESSGFVYTAYTSWDAFFREIEHFHVQGISSGGGVLQINFINGDHLPVGQYNGFATGVGAFEAGGDGRWHKK